MKIVILDGHTLNPGDLSWAGLEALGPCDIHERTKPEEVIARMDGAGVAVTNKVAFPRELLGQLPALRFIAVTATGYNVVDVEAARERGIPVSNVPTYGTQSVAQMVFAHVLNLTQHVADHARAVEQGRWIASGEFCFWEHPLVELADLTMGIVGFGRIGRATATLARAFGMNVLAHDASLPTETPEGVEMVPLEPLLRQSDVVSLHCPLTPETEGLVNAARLSLMKPSALLINTSRGPLVDEQALAEALNAGQIAGAGLDVLTEEPNAPDNPLVGAKNCYITPHIAWATRSARRRLLETTIENVKAFLAGHPQNVVGG